MNRQEEKHDYKKKNLGLNLPGNTISEFSFCDLPANKAFEALTVWRVCTNHMEHGGGGVCMGGLLSSHMLLFTSLI